MKLLSLFLILVLLLSGCGGPTVATVTTDPYQAPDATIAAPDSTPEYCSHFETVTQITVSDEGITVNGGAETEAVFTSHDIIYYEDLDTYNSGNPYGEGEAWERHSAGEAQAHLVVNITAPGAYRVTGKLSAGQLRVDLGEAACDDPDAVVELILKDVDITCTVAPAVLILNTYECDGGWSTETASADVDTSTAGANLILEGENTVTGSHVAKIFKDSDEEKKLWKQDGAIYSYQSLNVFGPGSLTLNADNEGLDTELHLTINGGRITIRSGNDGINTNEDGVSVTTINGGDLLILAGLGAEGDGIDSNGYLVINGGSVVASANPAADAGLDSDMGSYIHGGTVVALGSTMDWAESDSRQVTMNLQFASYRSADSTLTVAKDGQTVFSFDPAQLGSEGRQFQGAILSCPSFCQGERYQVSVGGITQSYTGTDVGRGGFGSGRGGFATQHPGSMGDDSAPPDMPQGGFGGERADRPEGNRSDKPGKTDGEIPAMPEGEMPSMPERESPEDGFHGQSGSPNGAANTEFFMADKVNCFSGVTDSAG